MGQAISNYFNEHKLSIFGVALPCIAAASFFFFFIRNQKNGHKDLPQVEYD